MGFSYGKLPNLHTGCMQLIIIAVNGLSIHKSSACEIFRRMESSLSL